MTYLIYLFIFLILIHFIFLDIFFFFQNKNQILNQSNFFPFIFEEKKFKSEIKKFSVFLLNDSLTAFSLKINIYSYH
jgi:hypothetical protein